MKWKNTFFFFVFVIFLGGITYYLEFYQPAEKEKKENQLSQIFNLVKDQVAQLKVTKQTEVITLKKTIDGWNLASPVEDLASNDSVESFLSELIEEKSKEVAKEGSDINWKVYGLDQPEATIEIQDNAGKKTKVAISSLSNFEGNIYLRRDDDLKVLVGNGAWRTYATKMSMEFRDKRFLRGRVASVDSLEWQSGKQSIKLNFKDNNWQIEGASFEVDNHQVKSFLDWIDQVKVTEFMSQSDLNSEMKSKFKAQQQKCQISLKLKDKNWTAKIYEGSDHLYWAFLVEENRFVRLSSPDIEKIVSLNKNYFRDHKKPFELDQKEINQITYQGPLKKWTLVRNEIKDQKKKEEGWILKDAGPDIELDPVKVQNFLEALGKLEASDFLGSSSSYKTTHSLKFRIFKNSTESEVEFKWGESFKKKVNKEEKVFYPVKSSLMPEVMSVEARFIEALGSSDIIKLKKTSSSSGSGTGTGTTSSDVKVKEDKK